MKGCTVFRRSRGRRKRAAPSQRVRPDTRDKENRHPITRPPKASSLCGGLAWQTEGSEDTKHTGEGGPPLQVALQEISHLTTSFSKADFRGLTRARI